MSTFFHEHISRRWLASPLAVWGKLPSHRDFLRHNTTAAQAQDWQDWVTRVWSQRPAARRATVARNPPAWVALEPRKTAVDLAAVPVAFVMQPGAMPFAPKHCVQGVVLSSHDEVGRPCPLIFFQQIAPGCLRRTWRERRAVRSQEDILYWLSRIAARTHAANRGWDALVHTVDALWQLYEPDWQHLMGTPLPAPTSLALDTLLRQFCEHDTADAARGLKGVQRMPWVNWPSQILRIEQPMQAFWQQDMRGGYVNVSEHLPKLWEPHT